MSPATQVDTAGERAAAPEQPRSPSPTAIVVGLLLVVGAIVFASLYPARAPVAMALVGPIIASIVAWILPGAPRPSASNGGVRSRLRVDVPRLFVAILAGALVAALIFGASVLAKDSPRGEILAPVAGQRLEAGVFAVTVELSEILDDRHVWVVVERGDGLYPKEPELPRADGRWTREIFEPGPPHRFSLVLLMVTGEGHGEIARWLDRGAATKRFPPLPEIPGSRQLAVVSDLVQTPRLVEVPEVVGERGGAARSVLEARDLRLAVRQSFTTRPKGRILSQDPAAGTRVVPGATVAVVMSKGRKPVCRPGEGTVPKVESPGCRLYAGLPRVGGRPVDGGHGHVDVFRLGTTRPLYKLDFTQHPMGDFLNPLKALAWSPNGRRLAAVFHHDGGGHIEIRDVRSGRLVDSIPIDAYYYRIEFSADGRRIRAEDGSSWRVGA